MPEMPKSHKPGAKFPVQRAAVRELLAWKTAAVENSSNPGHDAEGTPSPALGPFPLNTPKP